MADTFDPYREALVVEVETAWPDEYDDWEPTERARVERLLHQAPDQASQLEYVRTHTGFCRRILVTRGDFWGGGGKERRRSICREWGRKADREMGRLGDKEIWRSTFSPSPTLPLFYLGDDI